MQRYASDIRSGRAAAIQYIGREVEARGRGRNGTSLFRIDGLIATSILYAILTADIGRQRDMSDPLDFFQQIAFSSEAYRAFSMIPAVEHFTVQYVGEAKLVPDANFAARSYERLPGPA